MALSASSSSLPSSFRPFSRPYRNPRESLGCKRVQLGFSSSESLTSSTPSVRVSAISGTRARFVARRKESIAVRQLARPLSNVGMRFFFSVIRIY